MSDRQEAARAALEAALAATSDSAATAQAAPLRGGPPGDRRRVAVPPDREQDPRTRDGEPDPHDVARQIVLRQLAMAPRSRQQLRDKLRQRGCPDEVAEAVLDRMADVGLVDDEAYAAMLVRSQQAGRGLARRALVRELQARGIDGDLATAALEDIDPEGERDRARQLVARKLATMHGLEAAVQTRRLAGMLARKGYPADVAIAVIREAIADAPEHQRD